MTGLDRHRGVHVWRVDLDEPDHERVETLSVDELLRLGEITHTQARRSFLRSRSALRRILSTYLDCDPADIEFDYGDNGKPRLGDDTGGLQFNMSHSRNLCLVAVARQREVGVDVEFVEDGRDHAALARRFFSAAEQSMLAASDDPSSLFVRMWTLKEAAVKARGWRLLQGLDRFECRRTADGAVVLDDHKVDSEEQWASQQWAVMPGAQAAVVVQGSGIRLQMSDFRPPDS